MLGHREERAARRVERNAPLYGVQQKQLGPRLLQQYDLIAERETRKAGQILGPLDGHEEQPRARLVDRLVLMRVEIGRHELRHNEAGVGATARVRFLVVGHIDGVV